MAYTLTGDTFDRANPTDFGIVGFVSKTFAYAASGAADDDLISSITYKDTRGGTIGVLTFAYVGATNNIATITRTT